MFNLSSLEKRYFVNQLLESDKITGDLEIRRSNRKSAKTIDTKKTKVLKNYIVNEIDLEII